MWSRLLRGRTTSLVRPKLLLEEHPVRPGSRPWYRPPGRPVPHRTKMTSPYQRSGTLLGGTRWCLHGTHVPSCSPTANQYRNETHEIRTALMRSRTREWCRMPGSKPRVVRGILDERTDLCGDPGTDPGWLGGDVGVLMAGRGGEPRLGVTGRIALLSLLPGL